MIKDSFRTASLIRVLPIAALVTFSTACGAATSNASGASSTSADAVIAADGTQALALSVGNSMSFTPRSIRVAAGKPVTLALRNGGFIRHDFALTDGASQPVKIEAGPDATSRGTFIIEGAGTYTFICSVPGHADAGMKGTVIAQ